MKKKNLPFINIGFSSIILVLMTLCLVSFSALSVLTANSDYQLSKKASEKIIAYYNADLSAKEAVFCIDKTLYQLYVDTVNQEDFFLKLTPGLFSNQLSDDISNFQLTKTDNVAEISYEVKLSENKNLYITLSIHYPELSTDSLLTITEWQTEAFDEENKTENSLRAYLYGTDEQ